jgi:Mlc titration factor MtfA (ptsG expression regulator)
VPLLILATLLALLVTAWVVIPRWQRARRRRLAARPPPPEWAALLAREAPLFRRLPAPLQERLQRHMQVFLHDKRFVGCDGLVVDERMRLVIAAYACLLLLERGDGAFPGFTTILVYPETFVVPTVARDGYLETHGEEARLGESWERGPLILSWADIERGAADGGYNVVLHEFAHKLDEENGAVDGVPALPDAQAQSEWVDVMGREYDLLRLRARNADDGVLDDYAATSPAEFFAVATECFFARPQALAARHPRLYAMLQRYYRLDPATWEAGGAPETRAAPPLSLRRH